MGIAELDEERGTLTIRAHFLLYGKEATPQYAREMADEVNALWNEPEAIVTIRGKELQLIFSVTAEHRPDLDALEVVSNTDPTLNFFRIEAFALGNISFVDGLGCNSGYFKSENLYVGSTTAAHEFGHTLGLDHPLEIDIRGKGRPGIMFPRGTWVDPPYQYDPAAQPGAPGGTMHPMHRRVNLEDIGNLNLHKLEFENGKAVVGEFTNVWHEDHAEIS